MRGPTHIAIGLCSGMALATVLDLQPKEVNWFLLLVGSLAPDIDEEGSSIAKSGNLFSAFLPRTLAALLNAITQGISVVLKLLLGHRGLTHWPVIPIAALALAFYYQLPWLFWFSLGYLMHILADACTVSGVPLLAPLSFENRRFLMLRTGSGAEKLIGVCCAVYMAYWGWIYVFPPQSKAHILENLSR